MCGWAFGFVLKAWVLSRSSGFAKATPGHVARAKPLRSALLRDLILAGDRVIEFGEKEATDGACESEGNGCWDD